MPENTRKLSAETQALLEQFVQDKAGAVESIKPVLEALVSVREQLLMVNGQIAALLTDDGGLRDIREADAFVRSVTQLGDEFHHSTLVFIQDRIEQAIARLMQIPYKRPEQVTIGVAGHDEEAPAMHGVATGRTFADGRRLRPETDIQIEAVRPSRAYFVADAVAETPARYGGGDEAGAG